MGHPDYRRCRRCNRPTSEVGPLSWTRQCAECGDERLTANVHAMHARSGPEFDRWRHAMVASVLDPAYVGALVAAGILEPQD